MSASKEETKDDDDGEDDDVEDLVSTINYNTITSMTALREMLGKDSRTNHDDVSWFQHYFLRHVNRLPSRSQYAGRRLSECKEEDELHEDTEHAETSKQKQNVDKGKKVDKQESIDKSLSSEPLSPRSSLPSSPRKAQSTETLPMSPKYSKNTSPHMDKRFFEAGLIEMKSQASSSSTLDYDSTDEVWVKRFDSADIYRRRKELGSQPLPTVSNPEEAESSKEQRPRAGTWGQSRAHGAARSGHTTPQQQTSKPTKHRSKSPPKQRNQEQQEGKKVEEKHTGRQHNRTSRAQSPSRKAGVTLFDAFRPRSKSDASKSKKGSNLISQMRNVVQYSLMSPGSSGRSSTSGSNSSTEADINGNANRYKNNMEAGGFGRHRSVSTSDGPGINRPRATSESLNKGAVSKVMELFRHRSNSAVSSEDKRRAKAAAFHQHHLTHGVLLRRGSLDPDRRRLSLGHSIPHRGSDVGLDPSHAAILFRDSRGLPVADPFLEKVNLSDLEEDESQIFVKFFRFHKCYDLIPTSAKLVVFDTQLLVKKAFYALVDNGVRAAPLWDSVKQEFVGMLTITDFIRILQKYYTSSMTTMEDLEEHKLETWKQAVPDHSGEMISIGPDVSLYEAIKVLIHNRIHRLPVIDPDTGNVLYILTHKRILRFLFLYINDLPKPSYMNRTLSDLNIGTYENIETVSEDTTLILALKKFVERRVSALPVVDENGRLVDIFAKFDVINLAAERTYDNLDITLKKANEHRNEWFEGVHRCHLSDTLSQVLEKIVKAEVHRLVVVDEDEKAIGIISLSDLLVYLVLRPCGDDKIERKSTVDSFGNASVESYDEDSSSSTASSRMPSMTAAVSTSSSSQLIVPSSSSSSNDTAPSSWREVTVSGGE